MKIEIYDTTLRDGAQGAGISYTMQDKLRIIHSLDDLGVSYIEAGNFMSEGIDADLFREAGNIKLKNAKLAAFGSTRRALSDAKNDPAIISVAQSPIEYVTIFGKSSATQVREVLNTTMDENLEMIRDTIAFLKAGGKKVIFDAEHFFDGYSEDPSYAMLCLKTAVEAEADTVVLCDTNGGNLPDVIGMTVAAVRNRFADVKLGIHCHNDMGMAVACSLSAVLSGVAQIHGTVSGIGERCGNANIDTLIPLLQLKLGYDCIPSENLQKLTHTARHINEIANHTFDEHEPFVGGYAFTHKAGMHIDAVKKHPDTFEHIPPDAVGNYRNILISELSGRAALQDKMSLLVPSLDKNSPQVKLATEKVKEYEARGYQYEDAEASLMLIIYDSLGLRQKLFDIETFNVLIGEPYANRRAGINGNSKCSALIKVKVGNEEEVSAAEGNGPVNALDGALRRSLMRFYPELDAVRLTDYKVRVINSGSATASVVKVFIESTDGKTVWRTTGVSGDIIEASWQALLDSIEYMLLRERIFAGLTQK